MLLLSIVYLKGVVNNTKRDPKTIATFPYLVNKNEVCSNEQISKNIQNIKECKLDYHNSLRQAYNSKTSLVSTFCCLDGRKGAL